MSDDVEARNDSDPAAQVASELRARLRALPPDELLELAAQLVNTYVIEGVLPLSRAAEGAELAADTVGEETFAQLLKRLKAGKRDPILDRFLIDGENISVRIDGMGVLPLTEYRRPNAPPPAAGQQASAQQKRESVPGASASIYNRSLYQPEQQPATARSGAAPSLPQPAARAQPAPAQPVQPAQQQQGKKEEEKPKSDRFSLIELE